MSSGLVRSLLQTVTRCRSTADDWLLRPIEDSRYRGNGFANIDEP